MCPEEMWTHGHFSNIKNASQTATFSRKGHQPKTEKRSSVVTSDRIQKYKIMVSDEEFFTRKPFVEELGCDTELMSSIFPFCIYNSGNF